MLPSASYLSRFSHIALPLPITYFVVLSIGFVSSFLYNFISTLYKLAFFTFSHNFSFSTSVNGLLSISTFISFSFTTTDLVFGIVVDSFATRVYVLPSAFDSETAVNVILPSNPIYPSGTVDSSIVISYVIPALAILILSIDIWPFSTKISFVPSISFPLLSCTQVFVSVFTILILNPAPFKGVVVPFIYFTKLKLNEPCFSGFSTSSITVFVFLSNDNLASTVWLSIVFSNIRFPLLSFFASSVPTVNPILSIL